MTIHKFSNYKLSTLSLKRHLRLLLPADLQNAGDSAATAAKASAFNFGVLFSLFRFRDYFRRTI